MTSSLVGSEMCIRDRRNHRQPYHKHAAIVGFPMPLGELPTAGHAKGPVSYTHLTLPTICV
eukprot:7214741-Prorocentrum_lima.AAC.1